MKHLTVLIESPCLTNSGYGRRSADFIKAFAKARPNYKLQLIPISWGETAWDGLDKNDESNKVIFDNIINGGDIKSQPDIHIQITVPNEARPIGKFNILVTAGIETNLASTTWLEGCNKMDLILGSSEHSKIVFEQSSYREIDQTGKVIGELKLVKPVETMFEGYDTSVFKQTNDIDKTITDLFNEIETDFNFLFVGHWLNGVVGADRKNVGMLITTFLNAFKDTENTPGLILKTNGGTTSRIDYNRIVSMIESIKTTIPHEKTLPKIYVIHGNLTNSEMNSLNNHTKVNACVSISFGEGFGRPLLEFAPTKKPMLVSNWSGHLDFLTPTGTVLLDGKLEPVHPSVIWENVIVKDAKWFKVDYNNFENKLKDVFQNYTSYTNRARKNTKYKEFTFDKMVTRIDYLLTKYIPTHLTSEEITLNL